MAKKPMKRPRADKNKKAARHAQAARHAASEARERGKGRESQAVPEAAAATKKEPLPKASCVQTTIPNVTLIKIEDPRLQSRLFYGNPVCILTCAVPESTREKCPEVKWRRNAMILSWLTPINNEGGFICSMHKRRFSSDCIIANKRFVLSVPVKGMEPLLLAIGGDTGRKTSKFETTPGLRPVALGQAHVDRPASSVHTDSASGGNPFSALEDDAGATDAEPGASGARADGGDVAVAGCAAHVLCVVQSVSDADDKHWLVKGQIEEAHVHPAYWNDKQFMPTDPSLPPYMSFLGATRFAYIT